MRPRAFASAAAALLCFALSPVTAVPPSGASAQLGWSPGTPAPNEDTTFTISAHDPDGVVTSATLQYGDGTAGTIAAPRSLSRDVSACVFGDTFSGTLKHQYARSGEYTVVLTVTSGACPLTESLQPRTTRVTYRLTVAPKGSTRAPVAGV